LFFLLGSQVFGCRGKWQEQQQQQQKTAVRASSCTPKRLLDQVSQLQKQASLFFLYFPAHKFFSGFDEVRRRKVCSALLRW
jgi:hypothetical protein